MRCADDLFVCCIGGRLGSSADDTILPEWSTFRQLFTTCLLLCFYSRKFSRRCVSSRRSSWSTSFTEHDKGIQFIGQSHRILYCYFGWEGWGKRTENVSCSIVKAHCCALLLLLRLLCNESKRFPYANRRISARTVKEQPVIVYRVRFTSPYAPRVAKENLRMNARHFGLELTSISNRNAPYNCKKTECGSINC